MGLEGPSHLQGGHLSGRALWAVVWAPLRPTPLPLWVPGQSRTNMRKGIRVQSRVQTTNPGTQSFRDNRIRGHCSVLFR